LERERGTDMVSSFLFLGESCKSPVAGRETRNGN